MTAKNALALHTWTLDTTPMADLLRIVRATGWDAVELRRLDWERADKAGQPASAVVDQAKASGLGVACVGVELGWMWASGEERARLFRVFDEQCGRAASLGCARMMSPVDRGRGEVRAAAASIREAADIAARHGVRLAVEFNSQAEQLNTLERMREVMALVSHPAAGLLLDTYHLGRRGPAAPARGRRPCRDRLCAVQRRAGERTRAGQGPRSVAARQGQRAVQGDLRRDRGQGL